MKIAPGVRVRASSRGFSAGIGPRAARVHVGTRGVGVSSGVGPFSAYSHLGGGSRGRSGGSRGGGGYSSRGPSRTTLAALEREARRAEKEQEIAQIEAIKRALVAVHRAHSLHRHVGSSRQRRIPIPKRSGPGSSRPAGSTRSLRSWAIEPTYPRPEIRSPWIWTHSAGRHAGKRPRASAS